MNKETGKGLPDISLMQPLCKELNITINDLLSGEKVDSKNYQEKFEENILNTIKYSSERIIKSMFFYVFTFFSGIIVIPTLGVIAPGFIFCSIIALMGGFIKLLGYVFQFKVPFITFRISNIELNPIVSFILSIVLALILYLVAKGAWKLLKDYIKYVKDTQKKVINNYKVCSD